MKNAAIVVLPDKVTWRNWENYKISLSAIWIFHGGKDSSRGLLGCGAV